MGGFSLESGGSFFGGLRSSGSGGLLGVSSSGGSSTGGSGLRKKISQPLFMVRLSFLAAMATLGRRVLRHTKRCSP